MDTKQTRLRNLRQLIKREGAVSQLALRLQISPIYIYRVLDGKFTIGDSMARKIEDAYGRPQGWMDNAQDSEDTAPNVVPTLTEAQHVSPEFAQRHGIAPQPQPVSRPAPTTEAAPATAHPTAGESSGDASDDGTHQRLISAIISTLDRMLVANGVEMSEMQKARLLMQVAEQILDQRDNNTPRSPKKPALRIS
jgi:hypothetical protein